MNTKLLYLSPDLPSPPDGLRDAVHYICHRCYVGRALWCTDDERGRHTTFTKLHSYLLWDMVRNYRPALMWLLNEGIVETDGHYVVGEKSRGYRWARGYADAIRVPSSARLSKKITSRSRGTHRQFTQAHSHLVYWLKRARMDTAAAKEHVQRMINENPERTIMSDAEFRETLAMTITMIQNGEWEVSVCNYGRFHSPYTRLLSELRAYVSFDGEPVANVDLRNSQPLMLALAMQQEDWRCNAREPKLRDQSNTQIKDKERYSDQSLRSLTPHPLPYMFYKNSDETAVSPVSSRHNEQRQCAHSSAVPDDVNQYIHACESGTFYEQLMEPLQVPDQERGEFKRQVFKEIYYGRANKATPLRETFIRAYPSVWQYMCSQKRGCYQRLAHQMQRAESRLLIDTIVHRFAVEYPGVPIVSIHDSFLTPLRFVPVVQQVIAEEFARVGLRPTLKMTEYQRLQRQAA